MASKQATADKNLDAQIAKIQARIRKLEAFADEVEGVFAAQLSVLVGSKREAAEEAAEEEA